jgi:hypothetical protein
MIPVEYISSLGVRTIDTDIDMDYLSLLASTGQPSFKEFHSHHTTIVDSTLTDSTVTDSTVKDSTVTDSTVTDSTVTKK